MYTSETIGQIAKALADAQSIIEPVIKNKQGYSYMYADLEANITTLKTALPKFELSYTQIVGFNELQQEALITILMHSSGEWIKSYFPLSTIPQMKMTNALQNYGAALSYLRRYALTAICGLSAEDNDAADIKEDKDKGNGNINGKKEEKVKPKEVEKDLVDEINDDHLAILRKLCNENAVSTTAFCEALGIKRSEPLTVLDAIDNFSSKLAEYRSKIKK